MKPLGNLANAQAIACQLENLQLSLRQKVDTRITPGFRMPCDMREYGGSGLLVEINLAAEHPSYRCQNISSGLLLRDKPASPGAQHTLSVEILIVHRDHQDR